MWSTSARLHAAERLRRARPAGERKTSSTRPGRVGRCSTRGCPTSNAPLPWCSPRTNTRISSCRSGKAAPSTRSCRPTTCNGPLYLEFEEGVQSFAKVLAGLVRPSASVAVDELTGAMRRATKPLFPAGPPSDAALVVGPAKLVKTVDQISCIRKACRITEEAAADVQRSLASRVRQIDLSRRSSARIRTRRHGEHAGGHLAGDAEHEGQRRGMDHHRRSCTAPVDHREELERGDVLWTDVSITYEGYCSDFGRTWLVGEEPSPGSRPSSPSGARSSTRSWP